VWLKYFVKFKANNQYFTRYIKAKSYKDAIVRLINGHKVNAIKSIEFLGDPLPSRQLSASDIIKKDNELKERRKQGRKKYYQLTGQSVFQRDEKR